MSRRTDRRAWDAYITEFHDRRPGITEAVLSHCVDDRGSTPYDWLVAGIQPTDRVLDVACGSAPTRPLIAGRWLGVDRSSSELHEALRDHRSAVAQGDATALPVRSGSVDVVLVSMALMLIDPLDDALAEIYRVLVPGGELRALLPTTTAMTIGDRRGYARLAIASRSIPRFPSTPLDRSLAPIVDSGLRLSGNDRRRFTHPLADTSAARQFLDSWYTPTTPTALETRRQSSMRIPRIDEIAVPLRRILARRD